MTTSPPSYRSSYVPEQRILVDPEGNRRLVRDGFVIFPLLEPTDVAEATALYRTHFPTDPESLLTSMRADTATRRRLSRAIKALMEPRLRARLNEASIVGGVFFSKGTSEKTVVVAHRDFCLVDETRFRSYNLWVPLVDVDANNGCICILPNSHRVMRDIRGPNFPESIGGIAHLLWQRMVPLPMKAGEALLYDHSLVHGSWINRSDALRPAAVISLLPTGAGITLFWKRDEKLAVLPCEEEFFLDNDLETAGEIIQAREHFDYDFPSYDEQDFRSYYP